jgi:sugar-specific transcriptional regulator TrmB
MIREKLQQVGFTPGESEIYDILVHAGQAKASTVMKKTKIAHSKVYEILDRLVSKGLASKTEIDGIKHYQATPPERIVDYLESQKIALNQAQDEIKQLIPLIKEQSKESQSNVRMYSGKEGGRIVLKELIEESIKAKINYGYGTADNPFMNIYPKEMEEFFAAEKKYKFKTLLLFSKTKRQKQPSAEIRYLPNEYMLPVRTMIAGSKVFLVTFEKEITSIIIENEQIAKNYMEHFKLLWSLSEA